MMRFDLEREVDCWMLLIILMILLLSRMINHGMILVKLMIIAMTRMLNQYEYDIVDLRAESWIWTVLPGQVCILYINIYHIYYIIYLH